MSKRLSAFVHETVAPGVTYYVLQLGLGYTLKWFWQIVAFVTGRAFYCDALAGKSTYNISINGDMTVSCSCQDRDGSGFLGDLRANSFGQIFGGAIADRFRRELSLGKLPVSWCIHCRERRLVSKKEAQKQITDYALPSRGLMLENTWRCNLACTSCHRESYAKTRSNRPQITLSEMDGIAKLLESLKMRTLSFIKLGEPFLSRSVHEEIAVIKRHNPSIEIFCSTNGIPLVGPQKIEAALGMSLINFSIDGINTPMVRLYQQGGDFDRAYQNMAALCQHRNALGHDLPIVIWKYVVFRWNDDPDYIRLAMELARKAGVDYLDLTPTISPPWGISWRARFSRFYRTIGTRSSLGGNFVPICASERQAAYVRRWERLFEGESEPPPIAFEPLKDESEKN